MIRIHRSSRELSDYLMVAYCTAAMLTGRDSLCRILMLGSSILIVFIAFIKGGGKLNTKIGAFYILPMAFLLFGFSSALWARDSFRTLGRCITVSEILVTLLFIYQYYQGKPTTTLLWALMIGGYLAWTIMMRDTGVQFYFNLIRNNMRLSLYMNGNDAARLSATCLIINVYFIIYQKRIRWWTILSVPAFIILLSSGSKSGFLLLVLGVTILLVLKNIDSKKKLLSLFKVLVVIILIFISIYLLIQLPAFEYVRTRFQWMLNLFTRSGYYDGSTRARYEMIVGGFQTFKESPIFGVGLDNPSLYNPVRDTYLHNNFVELLAGVGIIGFILYYSTYGYIFTNFWTYRKYRTGEVDCCLAILLAKFVLDVGNITYYDKDMWFLLMVGFINVMNLKEAARQGNKDIGGSLEWGSFKKESVF